MPEYKRYEKRELIYEIGKLIQLSEDEVNELYLQWQNTAKENESIYSENQEIFRTAVSRIKTALTGAGVSFVKNKGLKTAEAKWFSDNIRTPLFNQIVGALPKMPTNQSRHLIHVYQEAKRQHVTEAD